ncbi:alpha/beta hydrolase, partial [Rhizobium ruizarguesonis]
AGGYSNFFVLFCVAARAADAGGGYAAFAKTEPTPPAAAGSVFDGDEGRRSEEAFLLGCVCDLSEAKAKVRYAV